MLELLRISEACKGRGEEGVIGGNSTRSTSIMTSSVGGGGISNCMVDLD